MATPRSAATHSGRAVRAEMTTTAPPERVYAAFADPEKLSHWFTEGARGVATTGGTMTWIFARFGLEVALEVVLADPGKRLVLRSPRPGRLPNVLEVTIEHGGGGGKTLLRLVNSGFGEGAEFVDEYAGVLSGWTMALGVLRYYLERQFGRPRRDFLVMHPARFDFADAFARYTTTEGLRSWLAPDAAIDGAKGTFALTLEGGQRLSGEVIARTAFETALAAREVEGVFELKSIRMGPDAAALAVRASLWNADDAGRDALEAAFRSALDRLARLISRS